MSSGDVVGGSGKQDNDAAPDHTSWPVIEVINGINYQIWRGSRNRPAICICLRCGTFTNNTCALASQGSWVAVCRLCYVLADLEQLLEDIVLSATQRDRVADLLGPAHNYAFSETTRQRALANQGRALWFGYNSGSD